MNPLETAIKDSGLFTQVEPDWLVETQGRVTFINRSRGVMLVVNQEDNPDGPPRTARVFHEHGHGETYASTGWYTADELERWWFPVMRSTEAWTRYIAQPENYDITEVLDFI